MYFNDPDPTTRPSLSLQMSIHSQFPKILIFSNGNISNGNISAKQDLIEKQNGAFCFSMLSWYNLNVQYSQSICRPLTVPLTQLYVVSLYKPPGLIALLAHLIIEIEFISPFIELFVRFFLCAVQKGLRRSVQAIKNIQLGREF